MRKTDKGKIEERWMTDTKTKSRGRVLGDTGKETDEEREVKKEYEKDRQRKD